MKVKIIFVDGSKQIYKDVYDISIGDGIISLFYNPGDHYKAYMKNDIALVEVDRIDEYISPECMCEYLNELKGVENDES